MNSNPDQEAASTGTPRQALEQENGSIHRSSSMAFVKIDLYAQARSEYLYTSLITGIIQVPILITIHELLTVRKAVNSYEIAFSIVAV